MDTEQETNALQPGEPQKEENAAMQPAAPEGAPQRVNPPAPPGGRAHMGGRGPGSRRRRRGN